MKSNELSDWFSDRLFEAGMNIDYYQSMTNLWRVFDVILILVAIACSAVCVYVSRTRDTSKESFTWSLVSFALLAVLLVIPVSGTANADAVLTQRWADLRGDLVAFQIDHRYDKTPDENRLAERQKAIEGKMNAIIQGETMPFRCMLEWAWAREAERTYGKGINTPEKVERERARIAAGEKPTIENHPGTDSSDSCFWLTVVGTSAALAGGLYLAKWLFNLYRRAKSAAPVHEGSDAGPTKAG